MKIYLIGGLGADERVFKFLKLKNQTQVISWIAPYSEENLKSYVQRLVPQINQDEEFSILVVSFGGIVAVELSKIINPKKVILISSVATSDQLPRAYVSIGKTGILNIIPDCLIKPPQPIMNLMFGAKNKTLLREIINDTDTKFIRWALASIIKWSNKNHRIKPIRIHGTNDKLIPLKGKAIKIKHAGHFMIVDKAEEISNLVNEQINYAR